MRCINFIYYGNDFDEKETKEGTEWWSSLFLVKTIEQSSCIFAYLLFISIVIVFNFLFWNGMNWNFPLGILMLLLVMMMMVLGSLNKKMVCFANYVFSKLLIYISSVIIVILLYHIALDCIYLCSSINIKLLSCWLRLTEYFWNKQSRKFNPICCVFLLSGIE